MNLKGTHKHSTRKFSTGGRFLDHMRCTLKAIGAAIEQQAAHVDAASSAFEGVSEDGQAQSLAKRLVSVCVL